MVDGVKDIYSISGCISKDFCDFFDYWKHNGYGVFNSLAILAEVADQAGVDLSEMTTFYYEIYPYEWCEKSSKWQQFYPEECVKTEVVPPLNPKLCGYDVFESSTGFGPECSPLSCNYLAQSISVNSHCLLPSLDVTIKHLEAGAFINCEIGPYRIVAVYEVGE